MFMTRLSALSALLAWAVLQVGSLLAQVSAPPVPAIVSKRTAMLPSKYSGEPPSGDFERRVQESNIEANSRSYLEAKMKGPRVITDPGALVNGRPRTGGSKIVDFVEPPDAFPSQAKCVIVGSVTSAEALVTNDKTYVYSDFAIKVETILKQDQTQPIMDGASLLGSREGGSIRFPSGHIRDFMVHGEGFPAMGERYVFFLRRWEDQAGRYLIGPTYQLKDGKVYPIDDDFMRYENMKEEEFLKMVRGAIGAQSQAR